jgi:glycine/D-amino acid oxidase-like deaminating enzyme/nitrite reductase/ring-hydroxylating ferredoxin subunit
MKQQVMTKPHWMDAAPLPSFPRLERNQKVDVVVVGAGIAGLTAAYLLTKVGRSVAVLERENPVERDTAHTSAHLSMVTDAWLSELVDRFGRDHAQAAWDAGLAAIAQIDAIVRDEHIACDFAWVPGYLHRPVDPPGGPGKVRPAEDKIRAADTKRFQDEAILAADLGFDAAFIDEVPFVGGPGVVFEDQARFHPRRYLAGVAKAILSAGGYIYQRSAAEEFCDEPRSVTANGHTITCDEIVLATHTPLMGNAGTASAALFQTKLFLYSTYVVGGRAKKGQVPDALFWDTADPYHYLRIEPHRDFDFVIFGGEDHKTGQSDDTSACYDRLERTLVEMIPDVDLTHRWSGQVIETPDGLPYIGDTAPHQFAATGFSGNGLTFGTLSAMMAADRIAGRANPWRELFDTGRTKIRGGSWNYLRENKDYPYYMVRDRFAGAEARSLRAIKRGEGRILERNGKPVAASRSSDGSVTMVSAICSHMGCVVDWNESERTWDCPCHGSRFKPDGAVIGGPAESPLPEAK